MSGPRLNERRRHRAAAAPVAPSMLTERFIDRDAPSTQRAS